VTENKKRRKYGNQRILFKKSRAKMWFRIGIHSLLSRADARGSADTIYCMWRISLLCGSGIVNDVTN